MNPKRRAALEALNTRVDNVGREPLVIPAIEWEAVPVLGNSQRIDFWRKKKKATRRADGLWLIPKGPVDA